MQANTIDEVIEILEQIIQESKERNDTAGYFAALYQKVTISVKQKLNTNYFDNDTRMEKLDVIFANRYFHAYYTFKKGEAITHAWNTTFLQASNRKLIVLQHLLLGMNAHINLDLGIAAAEVAGDNISDLEEDFNRINQLLASLVEEVQQDLARIWSPLLVLLRWAKNIDNFLIDFSMKRARDGAWKFARQLHETEKGEQNNSIEKRDEKIASYAQTLLPKSLFLRIIFRIVRFGERGSINSRIKILEN